MGTENDDSPYCDAERAESQMESFAKRGAGAGICYLGGGIILVLTLSELWVCHALAGWSRNLIPSPPRESMSPREVYMLSRRL